MQFAFNLQIKKIIIFERVTKRRGSVFVNLHLSAGKQAIRSFDMNESPI